MNWPITVWPGAVCNDWFGVVAFYASMLCLIAMVLMLVATVVWLIRNWDNL